MRSLFFASLLASALACSACGGSIYMPSRVANFDPDGAAQIDDEDVKKAFEAKPQLAARFNVAYFSFDPSKDSDVEKAVHAVPGVSSVYSIPALEAVGKHRFDESQASQPLSMKKLRLLAARAHADVLVVVDYAHKIEITPNALAALDVFLVPALFLPFRDIKVDSAVDAFVVDVRNGFMYGHVALSKEESKPNQTIYASEDELVASGWKILSRELEGALVHLVESQRATTSHT